MPQITGTKRTNNLPIALQATNNGALLVSVDTPLAGERNTGNTTGADHLAVTGEWKAKAMAYNGTLAERTVYSGPCLVAGIEVTTAMSAHASALESNGVSVYPIPASRAAAIYPFPGQTIFDVDCVWDPGSLSAGAIIVWYRPLAATVTW